MAERHFDAYSNAWEEIGQDLAELERLGHITSDYTPTRPVYKRTFTEAELDRIASADDDAPAPSIMRVCITDRLLRAIDELGVATVAYGNALDRHAAAVIAAYEAAETLAYGELDFRAQQYVNTVPGKNEAERKVNLDLAVMDDATLNELRVIDETCRHERTRTEAAVRALDVQQKSWRAQIAALQALLRH